MVKQKSSSTKERSGVNWPDEANIIGGGHNKGSSRAKDERLLVCFIVLIDHEIRIRGNSVDMNNPERGLQGPDIVFRGIFFGFSQRIILSLGPDMG